MAPEGALFHFKKKREKRTHLGPMTFPSKTHLFTALFLSNNISTKETDSLTVEWDKKRGFSRLNLRRPFFSRLTRLSPWKGAVLKDFVYDAFGLSGDLVGFFFLGADAVLLHFGHVLFAHVEAAI